MLKIREIFGNKLANWLDVEAITIYPFIFYADKKPITEIRIHEHIHILQVREKGWFRFYFSYLVFYCRNKKNTDADTAYRNISYEAEAYAHQVDWEKKVIEQFPEIKS